MTHDKDLKGVRTQIIRISNGKSILGKGNSIYKDPEAGSRLAYSQESKKANVAQEV